MTYHYNMTGNLINLFLYRPYLLGRCLLELNILCYIYIYIYIWKICWVFISIGIPGQKFCDQSLIRGDYRMEDYKRYVVSELSPYVKRRDGEGMT